MVIPISTVLVVIALFIGGRIIWKRAKRAWKNADIADKKDELMAEREGAEMVNGIKTKEAKRNREKIKEFIKL